MSCRPPHAPQSRPPDAAVSTTRLRRPAATAFARHRLRPASSIALLCRSPVAPGRYVQPCIYWTLVVEWDRDKAEANRSKHGVDFADAATVLSDDFALTRRDDNPAEERFATVGMDALGRVLVVIFTWRGEEMRLISARRATASERKQYEKNR